MCSRQFDHCHTDTNMFVETFHNKLKTFFMERRPNKQVDDLINLLLSIEEEDYWRRKRDLEYYGHLTDQPVTHTPRLQKGVNIPDTHVIKVDDETFEVKSQITKGCQYRVKRLTNECNDEDCLERFDQMLIHLYLLCVGDERCR